MIARAAPDDSISRLEEQIPWNIQYYLNTRIASELTAADRRWLRRSNKIDTPEYQLRLQYQICIKARDRIISLIRRSPGYDPKHPFSSPLAQALLA